MQPTPDLLTMGLILGLIGAIFVIAILTAKYLLKQRTPYQFTDDITDLSKIFKVRPVPIVEEQSEAEPALSPALPLSHYSTKPAKQGDTNE